MDHFLILSDIVSEVHLNSLENGLWENACIQDIQNVSRVAMVRSGKWSGCGNEAGSGRVPRSDVGERVKGVRGETGEGRNVSRVAGGDSKVTPPCP